MPRDFLVVMDSVGIGGAPDADKYFNGDVSDFGSNTVLHIAEHMQKKGSPLNLPHLNALGLGSAIFHSVGIEHPNLPIDKEANWAVGKECSMGKIRHQAIGKLQACPLLGIGIILRVKRIPFLKKLSARSVE